MFFKINLCNISAENNQLITVLLKKLLIDAKVKGLVVYFSRYVLQQFIP
ncbi:hypothetical protein HUN01_30380 [Nostoc edaphicum CCNP1411]|uniref:Uncharacterized protein n=1 Tax=Nostoc edaphicum CCNP1411 TaxID=1472755 RepID=A0A7D7QMJ3_9NOSO|nr:hypothetical protein HUN01_30380 [Nostoc edaphicum CCNP1411]